MGEKYPVVLEKSWKTMKKLVWVYVYVSNILNK